MATKPNGRVVVKFRNNQGHETWDNVISIMLSPDFRVMELHAQDEVGAEYAAVINMLETLGYEYTPGSDA